MSKEKENISSQSSDEDDEMGEDEFRTMQANKGNKRIAVSAEAYGEYNKKKEYIQKIIPKTEEQKQKIKSRILSSFLFSALDAEHLNVVINAMDNKSYKKGEKVIAQGESGDCLYVVEEGELDCTKHFKAGEKEKFLKTYHPGEAFGELALLYNAPRAATIIAKTDCNLWVLDRETFNHIVKTAAQKKRERNSSILQKNVLLKNIDPYEVQHICDALQSATYKKGTNIIKEGDAADLFYILEEGEVVATKMKDKKLVKIKEYKSGEYFGERALLLNQKRYCNITVTSDEAKVLSLNKSNFKTLFAPVESVMRKKIEEYKVF